MTENPHAEPYVVTLLAHFREKKDQQARNKRKLAKASKWKNRK